MVNPEIDIPNRVRHYQSPVNGGAEPIASTLPVRHGPALLRGSRRCC